MNSQYVFAWAPKIITPRNSLSVLCLKDLDSLRLNVTIERCKPARPVLIGKPVIVWLVPETTPLARALPAGDAPE